MPMLTTLRMRLPVWPFHAPLRTRSEKSAILSSTAWTSGTTFLPSTTIDAPLGRAQGHVQDGAIFRDVDLLAAEHGVDPLAQAGFLGQLQQKLEGFVGDAVLRVIEVEPTASAVMRSPRMGSSAKSCGDAHRGSVLWWATSAFHAGRAVSDEFVFFMCVILSLSLPGHHEALGECEACDSSPAPTPQRQPAKERVGVAAEAAEPGGTCFSFLAFPLADGQRRCPAPPNTKAPRKNCGRESLFTP